MDQVAPLAQAHIRVLQQDTQAVRSVSKDDQGEQEVRHALRRPPFELWGEMRRREGKGEAQKTFLKRNRKCFTATTYILPE